MKKLILIIGPSCSGKTTIAKILCDKYGMAKPVSNTTRPIRLEDGEEDGVSYNFISRNQFVDMLNRDRLLEYGKYGNEFYGLSKNSLNELFEEYNTVVHVMEMEGVCKLLRAIDNHIEVHLVYLNMCFETEGNRNMTETRIKSDLVNEELFFNLEHKFKLVYNDSNPFAREELASNIFMDINNIDFAHVKELLDTPKFFSGMSHRESSLTKYCLDLEDTNYDGITGYYYYVTKEFAELILEMNKIEYHENKTEYNIIRDYIKLSIFM